MFKVQEMRELIRLIDQSSINEFTYENDESTLTIKKTAGSVAVEGAPQVVAQPAAPVVAAAPITPEPKAPAAPETPVAKEEASVPASDSVEGTEEILSPMVGTFYQKPSPESPDYVKVGDKIEDETIVCIVEAMKLFNEIEAEMNGEIVEILVKDGDLVEYGQPLFRVKTK